MCLLQGCLQFLKKSSVPEGLFNLAYLLLGVLGLQEFTLFFVLVAELISPKKCILSVLKEITLSL